MRETERKEERRKRREENTWREREVCIRRE